MNEQPLLERATGKGVGPQVRAPFQIRQKVEGSFRKKTEGKGVCLVRNECSRGHTGKVWDGERSSVDVGQARELYSIVRMQEMWERLNNKRGLY